MNRDAETVPARHETPDVAELRRLYSEWQETVNPYGFRLMPSGEYYALAAAAVNALPALLDVAAERDALAAKVERVRELADEWTYNGEFGWDDGSHAYGPDCEGQALDYAAAKLRRALDEELQP